MSVALALVLAMILTETLPAGVDLRQNRPRFVEIDAGADHAWGRTATGRVLCWGSSVWGQLGDGTLASKSRPALVEDVDVTADGSAFGSFTCLLTRGDVRCLEGRSPVRPTPTRKGRR